jgi:hypothetical protein
LCCYPYTLILKKHIKCWPRITFSLQYIYFETIF